MNLPGTRCIVPSEKPREPAHSRGFSVSRKDTLSIAKRSGSERSPANPGKGQSRLLVSIIVFIIVSYEGAGVGHAACFFL